jgi:hypothetical protein
MLDFNTYRSPTKSTAIVMKKVAATPTKKKKVSKKSVSTSASSCPSATSSNERSVPQFSLPPLSEEILLALEAVTRSVKEQQCQESEQEDAVPSSHDDICRDGVDIPNMNQEDLASKIERIMAFDDAFGGAEEDRESKVLLMETTEFKEAAMAMVMHIKEAARKGYPNVEGLVVEFICLMCLVW